MSPADLIQSIREIFPQLTPEDQRELLATVAQLKVEAAERQADSVQDPMIRMFSQGFAALDREAAGLPPMARPARSKSPREPKQITHEPTHES